MRFFSFRHVTIAVTVLGLFLTACAPQSTSAAVTQDIITQKPIEKNKIPVTVLVKYAFSINEFEKMAEEKFPQLDIIQVGNYTRDRGIEEYARRMEKDDLTDIVMTWPLDVGEEYLDDRLLDLSGMPFTNNYHLSMLNTISQGGKLYYLPGPAQVRGIVYNKTLFAEKDWQVPKSFDEFVTLCQTIEASGMRSLQLGFANSEVLDTAFVGFSFADCFSKPQDVQWLEGYNNGNTSSIAGQMAPAFDTFQKMIDAGIWKPSDLDVSYAIREKMLFARECAMTEDSVLLCRMVARLANATDEFALMPFFSSGDNSDWARLYMVCYIGLNKHLAEPQNKEKYELVLQLMEYISSPEGQATLAADTGAMYSSVQGVAPPDVPEIVELLPALAEGRYAIFPEFRNVQGAVREGLADILRGTRTIEQVTMAIDNSNDSNEQTQNEKLGTATENFTIVETGSFIADVLREKANTDVALFMDNGMDGQYTGKGVSAKIYAGEQLRTDVLRIFPDLKHGEKGTLQTVQMTGEDLLYTLEYSIPVDNNKTGWFYYFSGMNMQYDITAQPGSRIKMITDDSGKAIDPQRIYTVAAMDGILPPDRYQGLEDTGISIIELLCDAIRSKESISPSRDGRFQLSSGSLGK